MIRVLLNIAIFAIRSILFVTGFAVIILSAPVGLISRFASKLFNFILLGGILLAVYRLTVNMPTSFTDWMYVGLIEAIGVGGVWILTSIGGWLSQLGTSIIAFGTDICYYEL